MPGPLVAIVSFRLGAADGVSVEAAKWAGAFEQLGWRVRTVAGEGPVDRVVPGLAMSAVTAPGADEVETALEGAELVVVENLCSLPLNPAASEVVGTVLRGRPAVLHHHDLPWQRPRYAHHPPPPDDPAWLHVTINDLSRAELAGRGIKAHVVRNTFDTEAAPGDRHRTRALLPVGGDTTVVLQPTRAIPRKNIPGGLALAEALGATYWLLGPAEDGYGPDLERLLAATAAPVVRGAAPGGRRVSMADAYAACDLVVLGSTWEGFGNPAVESAVHRRPLAIGPYPVAAELAAFGFRWFALDDVAAVAAQLRRPDAALLEHNHKVARRHFSSRDLPARIECLLASAGWTVS